MPFPSYEPLHNNRDHLSPSFSEATPRQSVSHRLEKDFQLLVCGETFSSYFQEYYFFKKQTNKSFINAYTDRCPQIFPSNELEWALSKLHFCMCLRKHTLEYLVVYGKFCKMCDLLIVTLNISFAPPTTNYQLF